MSALTRRPSAGHQPHASHIQDALPSPANSHHNLHGSQKTPNTPTLLRLPSTNSRASSSARSRRATNPTTPTLTPGQVSISSTADSPSYFSSQAASSGRDARSPGTKKPPAFFSGHGIDASRGPPNSLITRGNVDIVRRSQKPQDLGSVQQQEAVQSGHASPSSSELLQRRRKGSDGSVETSKASREGTTKTGQREQHMARSADGSEYGAGFRSQSEEPQARNHVAGSTYTSTTDGEQGEDLFIAVAKPNGVDASTRADRLRSRIAVRNNRQSFPSTLQSASSTPSRQTSKLPSPTDTSAGAQQRRASQFTPSSRTQRDLTPSSQAPLETPRSRTFELSPKFSFSSSKTTPKTKDQDLSPRQFLSQISSQRRPSYPGTTLTPPTRTPTYRPSNLQYSSSRDIPETPRHDAHPETASRADGTESLDSTGPAASVWDELDELKSRIRRIELGGKIPTTSGAAVANASADRPRTANTSVTTVSSSPKHQRKVTDSPAESTAGTPGQQKVHPLLKEALGKAKQHVAPSVYRTLEATASEAIALAELAGSAGPQGTLHSASSILGGASAADRQVRRKADNICRSLTELCIELCNTKPTIVSPALTRTATVTSRRPSVQVNGESPSQIRPSIEAESGTVPRSSPSRAMTRIEARRASLLTSKVNGISRESSIEPPKLSPSQLQFSTRFDSTKLSRASTSLHRTHEQQTDDEDDDPTLRAPSRAMTDFRDIRKSQQAQNKRQSREFTSKEPMPELQPSPSLQYTPSIRRPTVSGMENNSLLYRESSRRYNLDRQASPAIERQTTADLASRLAQPRQYGISHTPSATVELGRSVSLGRRRRGNSAGE